jgi:PAS domain S-box-containing protein
MLRTFWNHSLAGITSKIASTSLGCWLLALAIQFVCGADTFESTAVISSIGEFRQRQMAPETAECPIRIQATVTYMDPELRMLFVQDATAGSQVNFPTRRLNAAVGDRVMIEGMSMRPNAANAGRGLGDMMVWRVAGGGLPKAVPVGAAGLLMPENDLRFVEVRGTIRSAADLPKLQLVLMVDGMKLVAWVRQFKRSDMDGLLDAQVTVQGVCSQSVDADGKPFTSLWVSSFKQVQVRKTGLTDPFAGDLMPIDKLIGERAESIVDRRIRVRGRVARQNLGVSLIVRDETGQVSVNTPQTTPLALDDRIDVTGFPLVANGEIMLQDALFRIVEPSRSSTVTAAQANAALPTLDTIAKVLDLTREQARRRYPVKVKGTITHYDPSRRLLFIQDGEDAIFIDTGNATAGMKSGQQLEVSGVTAPGGVLTMISSVKLEVLGAGVMPEAKPMLFQQAMTGAYDCQRIQVKGTVQWLYEEENHLIVDLVAPDGRYRCTIMEWGDASFPTNLLNSVIQVEGVCMLHLNAFGAPASIFIPVDRAEDIEIIDKAPADEFSIRAQRIGDVLRFIPPNVASQRLKVRGIVTLYRPGRELFVQDPSGAIRALTYQTAPLDEGDEVELIGFRTPDEVSPMLQNSEFRLVRKGGELVPKLLQAAAVLGGTNNNELIKIEARLLENASASARSELFLESGHVLFHAALESSDSGRLSRSWRAGSLLQITGVCRLLANEAQEIKSFLLLVRSAADVEVLSQPSWLSGERIAILASVMAVIVLSALGWVAALRRRVSGQTELIRQRLVREASLEARCRELVEQANDVILSYDAKGHFLDINPAGERVLGYSRAEMLQMTLEQIVAPEHRRPLSEFFQYGGIQSLSDVYELNVVTKDGRHLTLELSTRLIRAERQAGGFESIARDVTDRKRLETQMNQAQKMESIGQLAAGVAHDFNNILTVIQGHASLLVDDPQVPNNGKDSLAQIAASAERAADLTRQLLAFSRKQLIQPRILDLNEEVGKVAKILERVLGEHIKLEVRCEKPLPTIKADPGMIGQVIMNLAVNARDAMGDGGLLEIATSLVEREDKARPVFDKGRSGAFVCLTVRDNGCGMDQATLDHLFEPFFTTKEIGKGTGLGLSTVYGIVKQHDGFVEVASKRGEGTVFTVYLPVDGSSQDNAAPAAAAEMSNRGCGTILIVEDEPALRKLAARVLEQHGFKTLQAASGKEALDLWSRNGNDIELLLTDMVMPEGISGGELAKRLSEQRPSLKIIYTSGYSHELVNADVELKDGGHFLAKPYLPAKLIQIVHDCLDRGRNK